MSVAGVIALITELGTLVGAIVSAFVWIGRISNGVKCQLRSDMLRIYYRHKDEGKIRQYEYENFVFLYEAYKALKGNSFIDKIYQEVKTWEIIT